MSKGLRFTPEEEKQFREMIQLHPKGFSEKLAVQADKKANSITMFFILLTYSVVGYLFFKPILDQLLYISNVYQLIALPILGVATGLSTMIILRFLFRIFLILMSEMKEIKLMNSEQQKRHKEILECLDRITNPRVR